MSSTKIEFAVQMTCDNCVSAVKSSLTGVPGVKNVDVDLSTNSVIVDTNLTTEEVLKIIQSTGRKAVVKGYAGNQAGVAIIDVGDENVKGVIRFVQVDANTCIIDGTVDGLKPGKHGLSVHECGDTSGGCETVGNFYNPGDKTNVRPIYGSLGEIQASADGRASFRLEDNVVKLSDIIGRALVISDSIQGQIPFGRRLACGIIARSSGLFGNPKTICACDGVSIWDERNKPKSTL